MQDLIPDQGATDGESLVRSQRLFGETWFASQFGTGLGCLVLWGRKEAVFRSGEQVEVFGSKALTQLGVLTAGYLPEQHVISKRLAELRVKL